LTGVRRGSVEVDLDRVAPTAAFGRPIASFNQQAADSNQGRIAQSISQPRKSGLLWTSECRSLAMGGPQWTTWLASGSATQEPLSCGQDVTADNKQFALRRAVARLGRQNTGDGDPRIRVGGTPALTRGRQRT